MTRNPTPTRGKRIFALALVPFLILNASTMLTRHQAQTDLDQRAQTETQIKEIEALSNRFWNLDRQIRRELSDAIKIGGVSNERLLATFPDEFIVLKEDESDPDETKVSLFVPQGQHRLRIEIWERTRKLCDQCFDLDSGRRYDLRFRVGDDWIETKFPEQKPIRSKLDELKLAPQSGNLEKPPVFVSPNQAPWRKGVAFFDEERIGVLSQFRFKPKVFDPEAGLHHAVSVRISAESDGPMSAAADDHLTILRLIEMADGTRPAIPYRYENGRYFFE